MRVRRRWVLLCVGLALLAGVAATVYYLWSKAAETDTLPTLDQVEAMEVIYEDQKVNSRFPIPRDQWAAILDAMTPAEKDDHPLTWQSLGMLIITTRGRGGPILPP